MIRSTSGGFTLVEVLIATAITLTIAASVFAVVAAGHSIFAAQTEAIDAHQRVRVGVEMLTRDLLAAGSGVALDGGARFASIPLVAPYRLGDVGNDARVGVYYRSGVISTAGVSATGEIVRHTYYLKPAGIDTFQLMHYDGRQADFPVFDDAVALRFEYFGDPQVPGAALVLLDPAILTDGPWCPDAADPDRFDADLLRIRRVRATLRVQAQRLFRGPPGALFTHGGPASTSHLVPDQEVRFDVTLRNPVFGC